MDYGFCYKKTITLLASFRKNRPYHFALPSTIERNRGSKSDKGFSSELMDATNQNDVTNMISSRRRNTMRDRFSSFKVIEDDLYYADLLVGWL